MLLVFWLSIMWNIIGGQLDERINAFLATCHVVIFMLYVIVVKVVANKMMMMMNSLLHEL